MYNTMTVAYELGQPLSEVGNWPFSEIQLWLAYFNVRNERERKARDQAKRTAPKPRRK